MSIDEKTRSLLKNYVEKSSNIAEVQLDQQIEDLKLPFDPYESTEKVRVAHYFLQVAAIDRRELAGRSETARALMIQIHKTLGDGALKPGRLEDFQTIVKELDPFLSLGTLKEWIPAILDSVNLFVSEVADGNLVKHAQTFAKPEEMVTEIGRNISEMGGTRIDHSWMYLRWMVRSNPDLRVFQNFSKKDLLIPLTSFVRNVAYCLGLCSKTVDWSDPNEVDVDRRRLTKFALDLFPEDPAIVDYPFYVLGRWLDGELLSLSVLRKYLRFWQEIYDKIKRAPVVFYLISRKRSDFERQIATELERLRVEFEYEKITIQLPKGIPHYKPDFVLKNCYKKNKTVILEPHGVWTSRVRRSYNLRGRTYYIWANPSEINVDEQKFVNKLRVFRENCRDMYYLVLIVPSEVRERIEWQYRDIADEIIEARDVPKLLYTLKRPSY